jgi:hypothetical protein
MCAVFARATLLGMLLGAATAAPAAAQRLPPRSNLWIDAGVGYGRLRVTCLTCSNRRGVGGRTVTVSIGGTPSRYVLLGVEGQVWTGTDTGIVERVRSLNLVVHWYPWGLHNGLYLRGGTGLVDGVVALDDTTGQKRAVKGQGLGISISLGYDIPLNRHFALTLQAGDQIAALGDLLVFGAKADDTIAYVSRFSVALTLR